METQNSILTRRNFFKTSTLVAGALLGAGGMQPLGAHPAHAHPTPQTNTLKAQNNEPNRSRGRMFFTRDDDFSVLSAAIERIFPEDDLGPGAIKLGVAFFIDNQLAGSYGHNAREYMQGPFEKGTPTQGYQTPMIRQEIFLEGVRALERESLKRFQKSFFNIPARSQDVILKDFEANKVAMIGTSSGYFFSLLREMTLCGVYADPIYNGNIGMAGWKMKEFPGAQMSYLPYIADKNFQKLEPVSLSDMQGGM
ncbi:gluconate 2-dehydrogenase subunit 3 family protein [Helicobacter sp. 11S02596-1]|uniref:gluconate 2-dehydrogenase subunit 3 family protein n=1 Tax=Helicobacter sp. 11S02596-1 TaxID=1476194 RepID=UPI000BA63D32|nr:gluconate 2-dehydrogenase subunit 3 family protein [Helicobacter sp. 11S02596-1]PAF44022.1 hypothetical protein BJI48_04355 [Helicobacter sp. 11S02596-1]